MIERVEDSQPVPQERAQRVLACLGDRSRFRVVSELLAGERCVSDLAISVGLSQSCTTRHLQTLEREGLVVGARQGKRVVYRVRTEAQWVDSLIRWAVAAEAPTLGHSPNAKARERRSAKVGSPGPALPEAPSNSPESGHDLDDAPTRSGAPTRSEIEDFLL